MHSFGLITRRSEVQILSPLPKENQGLRMKIQGPFSLPRFYHPLLSPTRIHKFAFPRMPAGHPPDGSHALRDCSHGEASWSTYRCGRTFTDSRCRMIFWWGCVGANSKRSSPDSTHPFRCFTRIRDLGKELTALLAGDKKLTKHATGVADTAAPSTRNLGYAHAMRP